MTKEEAWLLWMKESKHYVEYDWDTIKKSSHWEAFSRGWDAASVNVNGWDDAYKMGMEAGKEMEKNHAIEKRTHTGAARCSNPVPCESRATVQAVGSA